MITIKVWGSKCGDCGFISGLARVEHSDGSSVTLTGAGCFKVPRRGINEAMQWATDKSLELEAAANSEKLLTEG